MPTISLPPGLPYRQAQLLSLLAVRPTVTRAEYQFASGISRETARKDLRELLQAGLIVGLGDSRARRYSRPFEPELTSQATQSLLSSRLTAADELRGSGIIEHGSEPEFLNIDTQTTKITPSPANSPSAGPEEGARPGWRTLFLALRRGRG